MSDYEFVVDQRNPVFLKFLKEDLETARKDKEQRLEFLKKQAESIDRSWNSTWETLFMNLQKDGLIDPSLNCQDFDMKVNPEKGQFFIKKRDGGVFLPAYGIC